MKRIIDGKVYDTSTAEEICYDGYSDSRDFSHYCETLYRTKKGQYFIHGYGGPMSQYAESIGNNTTSGSDRLWLVDEARARDFCEKHDVEKALEIWGNEIEEG